MIRSLSFATRTTTDSSSDSDLLFDLYLEDLPIQWKRERGKTRYKHPTVKAWQDHLVDRVRQEMSILGCEHIFPWDGRCRYELIVRFHDDATLDKFADGKNVVSAFEDALNGVLWVDDKPKYVRAGSWEYKVAETPDQVGTFFRLLRNP